MLYAFATTEGERISTLSETGNFIQCSRHQQMQVLKDNFTMNRVSNNKCRGG